MISREELNYYSQRELLAAIYRREVLNGSPSKLYSPLIKEYGSDLAACHKITVNKMAQPDYHWGTIETVYKRLLSAYELEFDLDGPNYNSLELFEIEAKASSKRLK